MEADISLRISPANALTEVRRVEQAPDIEGAAAASLVLRGLVKRYGPVLGVNNVSFDVAPGEFVSLLGPSGSGKTTTLMMIAGFAYPDGGQVLLGGTDVTMLAPYRRNIGMVHQNYALFPHMTVYRNVAFPLRMRRMNSDVIRREVQGALEMVHLHNLAERLPGQLSGGQQQRVALARALVFRPPLLLMDEPLGALDKKLRTELQLEIKRLQRATGCTMVYVTHDQEEALSMSDRVLVMNNGQVEQAGTPQEIYDHPRSQFVAEFLGASNFLIGKVRERNDVLTVTTARGLELQAKRHQNLKGHEVQVGVNVTLSIRPERVRLKGHGAPPMCRAHVAGVSYYGSQVRLQLELQTGDLMTSVQPAGGFGVPTIGESVELFWTPDDVWPIFA